MTRFDQAEAAALAACRVKHLGRQRFQLGRVRPCADCLQDAWRKVPRAST